LSNARRERVVHYGPVAASQIPPNVARSTGRASTIEGPPEGLTRRALLNVLETFYRRPIVYLLPLVLLTALGALTALNADKEYRSAGVLNASAGSLLSEITDQSPSYGFERPSTVTARNINNLLRTAVFLSTVIDEAGLRDEIELGVLTTDEIRSSINAKGSGDTLVSVSATTAVPEWSQALAGAAIHSFVGYVKGQDIADATVRVDTYQKLTEDSRTRLEEAEAALEQFLIDNPDTGVVRPVLVELEAGRLATAQRRAEEALQEAETNLTDARLARDVAATVVDRQLRILDEPEVSGSPVGGLRDKVMTVGIFMVLGVILSAAFVTLAAVVDRSIRIPSDISSKFGLEVLGVVPSARRS